jgi:hypothetical protein
VSAVSGKMVMARNENPAAQFYWADWMRKTRPLTPSAKGIWMDLMANAWWGKGRCQVTGSVEDLARMTGASCVEMTDALRQFDLFDICDLTGNFTRGDGDMIAGCNGLVTVKSRRMERDEKNREKTRRRVKKHREMGGCNGDVTELKRECLSHSSSSSSSSGTTYPLSEGGGDENSPCETDTYFTLWDALRRSGKFHVLPYESVALAARSFPGVAVWDKKVADELRVQAEAFAGMISDVYSWLKKRMSVMDVESGKNNGGADGAQNFRDDDEPESVRLARKLKKGAGVMGQESGGR